MENLEFYKKYIGKYVRNQFGIAKVVEVFENDGTIYLRLDRNIVYDVNPTTGEVKEDRLREVYPITEHTRGLDERIRDLDELISFGDIVNGHLIERIYVDCTGRIVFATDCGDDYYDIFTYGDEIKTIIPKEMLKKIEYKVEE